VFGLVCSVSIILMNNLLGFHGYKITWSFLLLSCVAKKVTKKATQKVRRKRPYLIKTMKFEQTKT